MGRKVPGVGIFNRFAVGLELAYAPDCIRGYEYWIPPGLVSRIESEDRKVYAEETLKGLNIHSPGCNPWAYDRPFLKAKYPNVAARKTWSPTGIQPMEFITPFRVAISTIGMSTIL